MTRLRPPGRVFALCLLLSPLVGGCGPVDEDAPASAESAAEGTADVPAEGADPDGQAGLDPLRFGDLRRVSTVSRGADPFAHDPHGEVSCRTCHENPPGHRTHTSVECIDCHDAPTGGRAFGAEECVACHHAPRRVDECLTCHVGPQELPGATVTQVIDVAGVSDDPRRALDFRHVVHADVRCADCHRGVGTFEYEGTCASCHEDHHRVDADCLGCHAPLPLAAHDTEAHDGCSGGACHEDPTVLALPRSRSVCLSCHQAQVEHEPEGECSLCHLVAPPSRNGRPR